MSTKMIPTSDELHDRAARAADYATAVERDGEDASEAWLSYRRLRQEAYDQEERETRVS